MGAEYYGILYEDERLVVAVHLSATPIDISEYDESSDALVRLLVEAPGLLRMLSGEETVTSYNSIYALTRIAKLAEQSAATNLRVLLYLAFCKVLGVEPRIVSEFDLFPGDGRSRRVCVLGEGCYD